MSKPTKPHRIWEFSAESPQVGKLGKEPTRLSSKDIGKAVDGWATSIESIGGDVEFIGTIRSRVIKKD